MNIKSMEIASAPSNIEFYLNTNVSFSIRMIDYKNKWIIIEELQE